MRAFDGAFLGYRCLRSKIRNSSLVRKKNQRKMNKADVSKLISQLRIEVRPRHRNLKNPRGPLGRMFNLRQTVTALIKFERIEVFEQRADEARGYAERVS